MKPFRMKYLIGALLAAVFVVGAVTTTVVAKDKAKLEAKAKISQAEAEKIALAEVPGGKIKEAELEEEDGVLLWSFDIAVDGSKKLRDIEVDALTGKIHADDEDDDDEDEDDKDDNDDDDN